MREKANCLGNVSEAAGYLYLLFSRLTVVCNQVNGFRQEWQETAVFSESSIFQAVSGSIVAVTAARNGLAKRNSM